MSLSFSLTTRVHLMIQYLLCRSTFSGASLHAAIRTPSMTPTTSRVASNTRASRYHCRIPRLLKVVYAVDTNTHFLSALLAPICAKCSPNVALMVSFVIFGNLGSNISFAPHAANTKQQNSPRLQALQQIHLGQRAVHHSFFELLHVFRG